MTAEPLTERIIHLEGVIAHLQHDVDQMHSVLLAQQTEIDRLKTLLAKVESRIGETETAPENRDPQSERPPHY